MQNATFILDVRNTVTVVAVMVGCAAMMDIGRGGLAFEHMHGVVEHHRQDASNLGEQKQPEKPRGEAARRLQRGQRLPL